VFIVLFETTLLETTLLETTLQLRIPQFGDFIQLIIKNFI